VPARPPERWSVMQQETWRYPCELSYCVEHQTEVVLKSEFAESLNYALDRFVADEARFQMGLMAVLATGVHGVRRVAEIRCVASEPRSWMIDGGAAAA
jgi:hypothetical protein